ncbi:General substrate transporter [Pleurostoma richardsiae]|uniref:General substrate transporter n=1 Tax=Pleurostoma richardsiae TaxID=41990 RepID=A0AA38RC07_9PEZI|nr:General substrate transporter [Pleurostoma richardsiae]
MKPLSAPFTVFTDRMRGRGQKSVWIEYMITATCAIGNMLFGYDQGVMGGFLTSGPFERTFPSISGDGNATLQGFTVAVYEIGCAIGALSVIAGGDRIGRRATVMLGELIIIIGAVLQASSFSLSQLIVARIVTGVGNGMAVAVLPTWNGECSRATSRGRAVLWQLNVNIFGIAVAYWVDYGVNRSSATVDTDWSWRFPLALQVLFASATILLAFFLPDSARALVRKGRIEEARDVVDMLSLTEDPVKRAEETDRTMSHIERALEEEAASDASWHDIFTQGRPRFFQRLVLAIISICMLQISGVNLITYYAPVIFEDTLGMSRNMSLLLSGFNGLEYWLATFIPIPLVDRVGRRPIMLFAAIGQCISMAVLAGCTAYPDNQAAGYVATVFLFVFNTFLAIGMDGIPFLLPVELTPLQTRAKSVAIATGFFWLCNFFVVMVSPIMMSNIGYGTYILWSATNFFFIPMIYLLIPETMNADLEDIDVLFETNPTWLIGVGSRRKLAQIITNRQAEDVGEKRARTSADEGNADAVEDVAEVHEITTQRR